MAKLAPGSIRAEAGEEARARGLARVPVAAARAVFAETTRVPRALVHFVFRPQVQKYAVLVRALAKVREEPALRHAVPIELVQERALVALLAQPAQPVLADHLATPWVEAHARWRRRGRCIALDAKELVQIKVDAGDLHPRRWEGEALCFTSLLRALQYNFFFQDMLLLSVFGQQDLTRVVSSLGESAHFSQTEVSGTATSKSCRLAHPNGRDFYDLRGVGDQVFEASADTSVPFGPALWNARVVMRLCDNVGGCDNTPAPAVLLLEPYNEPGSTRKSCHRLGSLHAQAMKPLDRYTPGFLWVSSGVGVEMSYTLGDDCDAWGDSDKKFTVRVLIECDSSVEKLKIVTVRPTSNDNCEWSVRMLGAAGCPVAYPRRAQCAPGCARCARLGATRSRCLYEALVPHPSPSRLALCTLSCFAPNLVGRPLPCTPPFHPSLLPLPSPPPHTHRPLSPPSQRDDW